MSTDFDFDTREMSKKERVYELVSHFSTLTDPQIRQVVEEYYGKVWRCKYMESDDAFGILMCLKTSFLIEEVDRMGRPTDWQLTDRCKELMAYQEEHGLYISDKKADVILSVGNPVWGIPDRDEGAWRARDLDLDLEGRKLGLLRDVGIIEIVDNPPGEPCWWTITERFERKRRAIWEYIDE